MHIPKKVIGTKGTRHTDQFNVCVGMDTRNRMRSYPDVDWAELVRQAIQAALVQLDKKGR